MGLSNVNEADLNALRWARDGSNNFSQLACHLQAAPPGLQHLVSVKVPAFYFGRMSSYLQRTLDGRC